MPQLVTPNAAAAIGREGRPEVWGRRLGAEQLTRNGAQRNARHKTNESCEEKRHEVGKGAARQRGNCVQERERRARNGDKNPDRQDGEANFRFQLHEETPSRPPTQILASLPLPGIQGFNIYEGH